MTSEFVALKQGQVTTSTSGSTSYTIPTITGFPSGQALAVRICSSTGALWLAGISSDSASKTITSTNYPDGNIYAEANAIEVFMLTGDGQVITPTHIHTIADSANGVIKFAFGYFKKT